jgi:hypothetical protein
MAELLDWLKDKEDRLRSQQTVAITGGGGEQQQQQQRHSLQDKLDLLKRQQALQSELAANGPRLNSLRTQMERLKASSSRLNSKQDIGQTVSPLEDDSCGKSVHMEAYKALDGDHSCLNGISFHARLAAANSCSNGGPNCWPRRGRWMPLWRKPESCWNWSI